MSTIDVSKIRVSANVKSGRLGPINKCTYHPDRPLCGVGEYVDGRLDDFLFMVDVTSPYPASITVAVSEFSFAVQQ